MMPRQLKSYVTTSGFFELAVAAPTMKAALEIWGAGPDLFRRGYAHETKDSAIVGATMAKPGVILKRAVGGQGAFKEHADLPDVSTWKKPITSPTPSQAPASQPELPPKAVPVKTAPAKPPAAQQDAERKAAQLYAAAVKKREREAERAEAAERKALERRQKAVEKAENAIRTARAAHDARVAVIKTERGELELRAREEETRWDAQKRDLDAALKDAQ